jgi:hypothetical protein
MFRQESLSLCGLFVHGEIDRRAFLDAARRVRGLMVSRPPRSGEPPSQLRLGRTGAEDPERHHDRVADPILCGVQRSQGRLMRPAHAAASRYEGADDTASPATPPRLMRQPQLS